MEQDTTINQALTSEVQTTPKQSNFLVALLSILLLISCLVAGFFAYQTQQLVKEQTKSMQNKNSIEENKLNLDNDADNIVYTNSEMGISFEIPNDLIAYQLSDQNEKIFFGNKEGVNISRKSDSLDKLIPHFTLSVIESPKKYEPREDITTLDQGTIKETVFKDIINITEIKATRHTIVSIDSRSNSPTYLRNIEIPFKNKYLLIEENDTEYNDDFEKMVRTFRFTEPEASTSPLPVACTMEAKICPDGSAVGRSGPKCEFAPCPTPKP